MSAPVRSVIPDSACVCPCGRLLEHRDQVHLCPPRRSSSLHRAAMALSVRRGLEWLRAKGRAANAASADPEDAAPLWPLGVALGALLILGLAVTGWALAQ